MTLDPGPLAIVIGGKASLGLSLMTSCCKDRIGACPVVGSAGQRWRRTAAITDGASIRFKLLLATFNVRSPVRDGLTTSV